MKSQSASKESGDNQGNLAMGNDVLVYWNQVKPLFRLDSLNLILIVEVALPIRIYRINNIRFKMS
jgi:hypothetical protein